MRRVLNVIIVDDEEEQILLLENRLKVKHQHVKVVATAENVDEAYKALISYKPDLIFLDIEMPTTNGFELARLIRKNKINTKIVIVSGERKYAFAAIKISVFDYLHKPYSDEDLTTTLMKVHLDELLIDKNQQRAILLHDIFEKMSIKVGDNDYFIPPADIVYCETADDGRTTILRLNNFDKEISTTETLTSLEERLPKSLFHKIRPSLLVNISYINQLKWKKDLCVLQIEKELLTLKGTKAKMRNLKGTLQES